MDFNSIVNQVVSFNTRAPAVLGDVFTRVTVKSLLDAEDARRYIDPVATHVNVFPLVHIADPTVPDDSNKYMYLKIQFETGEVTALGVPWIDPDSLTIVTPGTAIVTLTDFSPDDIPRLRNALLANNFTGFTVEMG